MKNWLLLFSCLYFAPVINGQTMKKIKLGNSGCQAYFFCNVPEFNISYSPDSSIIYTGNCISRDSVNFGIICIQLKEHITNSEQSENLMISYMDFLRNNNDIASYAGYGKGHTLQGYPSAIGVIDYWTGRSKDEWKVKGWTDGRFIAVLFVSSLTGALREDGRTDAFLNGFRFPGMK